MAMWMLRRLVDPSALERVSAAFLMDSQAPTISSMSKVATKILDAQAFRGASGTGTASLSSSPEAPDHHSAGSCSAQLPNTTTLYSPSWATSSSSSSSSSPLMETKPRHHYHCHLPAHAQYPVAAPFSQFSLSSILSSQQTMPPGSLLQHSRSYAELSRVRVAKRFGFNPTIMPNSTDLKYGLYGIRSCGEKRVNATTIEAVRRTLRRKIKKTARLWVRIAATVPVTRKAEGIRMGKGKGAIAFYCTPVRPGQILFEMDRIPRAVAVAAMNSIQAKFPVRLGFVEWS